MTNTVGRVRVFVMLALGWTAGACGGDGSVTGPTANRNDPPVTNAPVWSDVSISGVVYDTAHRLLNGACVEVIEGVVEGYWCHSPIRTS